MSIIYSTLERLEKEANQQQAGQQRPVAPATAKSTSTPLSSALKLPVLFLMVTLGTLILWLGYDSLQSRSIPTHQFSVSHVANGNTNVKAESESTLVVQETVSEVLTGTIENKTVSTDRVEVANAASLSEAAPVQSGLSDVSGAKKEQLTEITGDIAEKVESSQPQVAKTVEKNPETKPEPVMAKMATGVTAPDKKPASGFVTKQVKAVTDKTEEAIASARSALSRGQYYEALSGLEELSPVPEKRADFWLIKGSAHLAIGQLDLAAAAFEAAQTLAPDNVQIAVQRAVLSQEQGDHLAALEILNDAAARNSTVPEIYLNKGFSEQALAEYSSAKRSFGIFMQLTEGRSLYAEQRKVIGPWLAQASVLDP